MYNQVNKFLQTHKSFVDWIQLQEITTSIINEKPKHIRIPALIAETYGAGREAQIAIGACLALIYVAIIVLDDLLDEDLRYVSGDLTVPQLANISAGLTSLAYQIGENLSPDLQVSRQTCTILTELLYSVSFGQALDSANPDNEDDYWQVVRLKSGAFFSGAFSLGGVAGGATSNDIEMLSLLGEEYGLMLQIHDDLRDALAVPANPDWLNGRFTLPILFAHLVDHPERERFDQIRDKVSDPEMLREAQEILVRSGAFSYGLFQIQEHHQAALNELARSSLRDKSVIEKLFMELAQPVEQLLHKLVGEDTKSFDQPPSGFLLSKDTRDFLLDEYRVFTFKNCEQCLARQVIRTQDGFQIFAEGDDPPFAIKGQYALQMFEERIFHSRIRHLFSIQSAEYPGIGNRRPADHHRIAAGLSFHPVDIRHRSNIAITNHRDL